jgi:hypothetical protein
MVKNLLVTRQPRIPLDLIDGDELRFVYREISISKFLEATETRHFYWKESQLNKKCHPISVLADGPGSGKSRFMQEIPGFIQKYLETCDPAIKETLDDPVHINITFNSAWTYMEDEIAKGMEHAMCMRMMHPYLYDAVHRDFTAFQNYCSPFTLSLADIMNKLAEEGR